MFTSSTNFKKLQTTNTKKITKNAILSVLLYKDNSLQPKLSRTPHFIIQGVDREPDTQTDGGRKYWCLILDNIDCWIADYGILVISSLLLQRASLTQPCVTGSKAVCGGVSQDQSHLYIGAMCTVFCTLATVQSIQHTV